MQYFQIDDGNSNVQDLTQKVRDGFAQPNLVLVQSNGLRIEDNLVTQSM